MCERANLTQFPHRRVHGPWHSLAQAPCASQAQAVQARRPGCKGACPGSAGAGGQPGSRATGVYTAALQSVMGCSALVIPTASSARTASSSSSSPSTSSSLI